MLREALGSSDALLPRTASERTGFVFVSLTAGICEEFLYRGFVLWYFSSQLGTFAGAVAATLLFGFAHVYLGWNHVFRTARIGVIFMLVVLSCGSLIPAMIMHAVMDLVAGDLGYRLNSGELEQGSAPVSGA
jgi:membrane protease YdiL (CAAX protease family)